MKKILIITDNDVGKHFVERIIETYTSENIYYVVQNKAVEYNNYDNSRFKFYEFDSTSFYKLSNLLKMEFIQVIISLKNQQDTIHTIKNIRNVKKQIRVIVLDNSDLKIENDNAIYIINSREILSARLIDYLPNVPVIAQNVGLGEGEIMEVLVPFGSSFVYRHVGVIEQKHWRIVAIYRNQELIMPTRRRMIQPNDLLVIVGKPDVLKTVYRAIKRELGQFPAPFGTNLYLFLDMRFDRGTDALNVVKNAVILHKQFKHKMIIKIYHPSDIATLQKIKSLSSDNVIIDISYDVGIGNSLILGDIRKYNVGLVIVSKVLFKDIDIKQTLFDANVPVLKISKKSFETLKDVYVILNKNRDLEKVSTTIFDISSQFGFNLELFHYKNENFEEIDEINEHYYNLSTIFSKSIKITDIDSNPIRYLQKKGNFLQCIPFSQKILANRLYTLFSTDSEKLYYKLDDNHQLFIPVQI